MLVTLNAVLHDKAAALHVLDDYASQSPFTSSSTCFDAVMQPWLALNTLTVRISRPLSISQCDANAGLESEAQVRSIRAMIEVGFDPQTEPYLRGMLSAIRQHLIKVVLQPL